jgi:hypothetical protein
MSAKQVWRAVLAMGLLSAAVTGCVAEAVPFSPADPEGTLAPLDDESLEDPGKLQVPPVKVRILSGSAPILAMAATAAAAGHYQAKTEYWNASPGLTAPASLGLATDLRMTATPITGDTEASIDAWLSPLPAGFTCPRLVTPSDWTQRLVTVSSDRTPYLLWMPHPDDPNEILGLLLEQDRYGQLVAAAWYRSTPPGTDGQAFRSQSFTQDMQLLVDRDGTPVADPNLIRQVDWYSIVMPLP